MNTKLIDIITNDAIKRFSLNEEELFFLKADSARSYLEERFTEDPHIVEALLRHSAFWLWWRELWAERDRKLLAQCVYRPHGVVYTFPIGKYVQLPNGDGYQPTETEVIPNEDVWRFYTAYHSWRRIQLYPNYQLIHACLGERTEEKIYVKL